MISQEICSNLCPNGLFPSVLRGEIGFSMAELVIQLLTARSRKEALCCWLNLPLGVREAVWVKCPQIRLESRLKEVPPSPWLMEIPSCYSKTEINVTIACYNIVGFLAQIYFKSLLTIKKKKKFTQDRTILWVLVSPWLVYEFCLPFGNFVRALHLVLSCQRHLCLCLLFSSVKKFRFIESWGPT